jgi:hypothetical protein
MTPVTKVRQRDKALPFPDELEARVAIMEWVGYNKEADCSIRQYRNEGFFVFVVENAEHGWLTRGTRNAD